MKTQNQIVDLSDLFVTQDEALDLLGDLLEADPTTTSLFGGKPVKISKPRPQWRIDGTLVVTNRCKCRTCGTEHDNLNHKVLVSMSYVDHEGRILKSVQTDDYNLLLAVKGGPYAGKKTAPTEIDPDNFLGNISYKTIDIEDIDFCDSCFDQSAGRAKFDVLKRALFNQQQSKLRKQENDTAPNKEFRNQLDKQRAEEAEQRLLDFMESFEQNRPTDISNDDLPY